MTKFLFVVEMKPYDRDADVSWGLPLSIPRPLNGSGLFEEFYFGRETRPWDVPRKRDNLVGDKFHDLPVRYDSCLASIVALDYTNSSSRWWKLRYGWTGADTSIHGLRTGGKEANFHEPKEQEKKPHNSQAETKAKAMSLGDESTPKPSPMAPVRPRKRLWLPLIVYTNTREENVITCPDSGSDDNMISREIAEQLGLRIGGIQEPANSVFVMANGRTVSAVGQVSLKCAFKKGTPATGLIDCVFYVLQNLAVPMMMGIEFLNATGTLTMHRDRLIEHHVPPMRAHRIYSVGRPKMDMVCRGDNYVGCATADTGSEVDLVSLEFASSRAFNVEDSCIELEFADGSTGYATGVIKTSFSIGRVSDVEGFIPRSKETTLKLFILDNLNADILVGADTIDYLNAFSRHKDCFVPAIPRLGQSDLNIIRYIGSVERGFGKALDYIKDSLTSSKKRTAMAGISYKFLICMHSSVTGLTVYSDRRDQKRKRLERHHQLLQDQLNNRNLLDLTDSAPADEMVRNTVLQSPLEDSVSSFLNTSPPNSSNPLGLSPEGLMGVLSLFYLDSGASITLDTQPDVDFDDGHMIHFNSDADTGESVSMSARITSAADEIRSEGTEQHDQVHEPAGYICPFCSNRDQSYPRREDLQR